ncbi:Serine/threonine-protein kinase PrkC [Stieleria neptunia]|uniref:Serine/threonine-protein kinase PrkC n=1 Tax=Stieleria neptunia TaxID=2527979 RepID=A0A518HMD1_9BACT|nr:protein kinase [Stieleria neptunia]QDV42013.1 Serine/threonine-protein kinase PrkC [Stieleria neptunia]
MMFPGYQLLSQRGAGKDGVAYLARQASTGNLVQLNDLTAAAANPRRWVRLSRQLQKIALLDHPGSRRLIQIHLDDEPRFVVLGSALSQTLADGLDQPSIQWPQTMGICVSLAEVLMHAHGLGVAHGKLYPSRIGLSDAGEPVIDFTEFLSLGVSSSATHRFDQACVPTSSDAGAVDRAANDIFALGAIVSWLLGVGQIGERGNQMVSGLADGDLAALESLVESMMAEDPLDRPLADEVCHELNARLPPASATRGSTYATAATSESIGTGGEEEGDTIDLKRSAPGPCDPGDLGGRRLGRFQIERRIGSGAWGSVYRAIDLADGATVAVKVLHPEHARCKDVVKRFRDEALILSRIDNPHVAKLLDVNCQDGVHYLAMEFVDGPNLATLLARYGTIDEHHALQILSDIARALVEPHADGVVHRDVKPANVIVQVREPGGAETLGSGDINLVAVTLVDFGLAQDLFNDVAEADGGDNAAPRSVVGTPAYMSPEQCGGEPVGPETDVYAMGATLFHLLVGRPPFLGDNIQKVIDQHQNQPAPRVTDLRAGLSDSLADVIDRTLAKRPVLRHADAEGLLTDVDRLLRGEPVSIEMHPIAPGDHDAAMRFRFEWPLKSAPAALWPHVSNTERLNQAIGLPVVDYSPQVDAEGGVTQSARAERLGMEFEWQEHPFEWIEGKQLAVLRDFQSGPFKWMISMVQLQGSSDGGTHLVHQVMVQPRSVLGRAAAALEVGVKAKRALKRVYHHIDRSLTAKDVDDPFRQPNRLKLARRRRLGILTDRLNTRGLDRRVIERLAHHIEKAPAQELARIRPLAFARQFALSDDSVVETFLAAAHEGLLVLYWDLLCPICRIPSDIKETLRELENHSHCPACNLEFEVDFAHSVELIFRVSPQIREADVKTYCIGGPAHSPHVVAQIRIEAGERFRLDLSLDVGSYHLRGLPCGLAIDFDVGQPGETSRWDVDVDARESSADPESGDPESGAAAMPAPEMKSGHQRLMLTNRSPREQVIRVERRSPRTDVLTAARASTLRSFRQWFPGEILAPGQLVSVGAMALMMVSISDGAQGSEVADAIAGQMFLGLTSEVVARHGGATLPGSADRIRVGFEDPSQAVLAALDLHQALLADGSIKNRLMRVALDHGGSVAVTVQDQIDYLGETSKAVERMFYHARPAELTLSIRAASDPVVASLTNERDLVGQIDSIETDDHEPTLIHRFRLP